MGTQDLCQIKMDVVTDGKGNGMKITKLDNILLDFVDVLEFRVESFFNRPQIEHIVDYSREEKIRLTAQAFNIDVPEKKPVQIFPIKQPYKTIKRNKRLVSKARSLLWEIKNCAYCGRVSNDSYKDPDNQIWHMDHIIPLSKGGLDLLENIVKSCADCNMKKGKKIIAPLAGTVTAGQIEISIIYKKRANK